MASPVPQNSAKVQFADFILDRQTGELWHNGKRTKLQDQSCKILAALLEVPGELVKRDELVRRLWPDGTYVDFDQSLNKAIARLREALGDSSEHPAIIETLPRRGYRLRQVESPTPTSVSPELVANPEGASGFHRFFRLFGATPYKQWEMMQIRILLWCVLVAALGGLSSGKTEARWGLWASIAELILAGLLMICATFLLYVAAMHRERLVSEVRRTAVLVYCLVGGVALNSWMVAASVFSSHKVLAGFVVLCGTAGGLKYTLFKNVIDRGLEIPR